MELLSRVFGASDTQPREAAMLQHLRNAGHAVAGKFMQDDYGWVQADLSPEACDWGLQIDCYRQDEEGIRATLNSWAAWLETVESNPHHVWLMQQMISTRQLYTLSPVGHDRPEIVPVCVAVCQFLAFETKGVYQVDGQGFFAADGQLLVAE
jgi:hypothetical protein